MINEILLYRYSQYEIDQMTIQEMEEAYDYIVEQGREDENFN